VQITLSVALDVLTQVARGLRHLHGGGVLHRDLAARNVLVKRRLFKVTDFGLSSVTGDVDAARMTSTTIGPVAWRAPETFHLDDAGQQIASVATDVYMLGGLAFEVLTAGRHVPFFWLSGERLLGVRGSSPMNTLDAAAAAGVTIPWAVVVGDDWSGTVDGVEQLMGLMARCLHAEPSRRPSMDDVLCEMDAIRCGTHVSPDTALPSSEDVYGTVTVTTPDAVVTAAPSPALRLVPPYYVWAAASPLRPPPAAAAAPPPPRPPPVAAAPHSRPTPAAPAAAAAAPPPPAAAASVVAPTEVCVDSSPGVSTVQGAVHNPVPSEVRSWQTARLLRCHSVVPGGCASSVLTVAAAVPHRHVQAAVLYHADALTSDAASAKDPVPGVSQHRSQPLSRHRPALPPVAHELTVDLGTRDRVSRPPPFPSHILRRADATTPTPRTPSSPSTPSTPAFGGRDAQLDQLRTAFECAAKRGVGMRHAIVGLGGVGKTQLVKEYVWRWSASYPRGVLWLEADSMSSLYGSYRAALSQLKLFDGTPDDGVDSDATAMRRVQAWLGGGGGWLLVLDNVDKPEMLRDGAVDIPAVAGSHVLVTSRARGVDRLRHVGVVVGDSGAGVGDAACDVKSLGTLSPSASLAMMCRLVWREEYVGGDGAATPWLRVMAGDDEFSAAVWVCGDSCLSGLPLSLRQAASVIRESGRGFVWFRQQFESMAMRALGGDAAAVTATDVRSWLASCGLSEDCFESALVSDLGVTTLDNLGELEKGDVMGMRGLSTRDLRRLWGAIERQLQSQRSARNAVTRTFALSAGHVRSIGGGVGDAALAVLAAVGALGRASIVSAWVLLHVCASMRDEGVACVGDVLWRRGDGGAAQRSADSGGRDGAVSAASLRALRDVVDVLERHSLVDVDVDVSASGSATVTSLGLDAMSFSVSAHRLVCAWAVEDARARGLWRGVMLGCMRGVLVGALRDHFALSDDNAALPVCPAVWSCVSAVTTMSLSTGDSSISDDDARLRAVVDEDLAADAVSEALPSCGAVSEQFWCKLRSLGGDRHGDVVR
jgi:hypothetical protein